MKTSFRKKIEKLFFIQQIVLFSFFSFFTIFPVEKTEEFRILIELPRSLLLSLGLGELLGLILFIFPRTMLLGVFYLSAHVGGCFALRVIHDLPVYIPALAMVSLWFTAWLRNPNIFLLSKVPKKLEA